jgi:hypothetical protein
VRLLRALLTAAVLLWAGSGLAQNLLPNPSLEVWLDTIGMNLPLGWLTSEITRPGSAIKSTESRTGSYSLELYSADTVAFATTTTLVQPGASYDFTGFTRTNSVLGGSFVVGWLGLLGGPIGTPIVIPVYRSTSYRDYTRRVTAPDSAYFCVVAFGTLPGATVLLDDVTLDTLQSGIRTGYYRPLSRFQLYPAQPNPFDNFTVINYSLSAGSGLSLRIYDLVGNEIRVLASGYRSAGFYSAYWNGTNESGELLSPGIYFCRLEVGDKTLTQKLLLLGN